MTPDACSSTEPETVKVPPFAVKDPKLPLAVPVKAPNESDVVFIVLVKDIGVPLDGVKVTL